MTVSDLEILSIRESLIEKQIMELSEQVKRIRELRDKLNQINKEKKKIIAELYLSRAAKQNELAKAARCGQGTVSRYVSEA